MNNREYKEIKLIKNKKKSGMGQVSIRINLAVLEFKFRNENFANFSSFLFWRGVGTWNINLEIIQFPKRLHT